MADTRTFLKIKIKSLAAESRIIHAEERKRCIPGSIDAVWATRQRRRRLDLYNHRTWDLRNEARASVLAYGLIRGRTYDQMEQGALSTPDFQAIDRMVKKYGDREIWKDGLSQSFTKHVCDTVRANVKAANKKVRVRKPVPTEAQRAYQKAKWLGTPEPVGLER